MKEHSFSMQLISQESPAMEINYLEGNELEWLMHKGSFWFWQRARFCEGERESIYQCMLAILTLPLFSFWFFSFFPSHSFLFYFLVSLFKFLFLSYGSRCCSVFCSQQGSLFIIKISHKRTQLLWHQKTNSFYLGELCLWS